MISLKLVLLFFIFEIDRLEAIETATSGAIAESAELRTENLLIEFMTDLKKFGFVKLTDHRLIILGKNDNFLRATKVLLESGVPYFISTKAETMVLPLHFGADSVVLFFVDGLTDSEINSAFAKLPNDHKCKVLLISVEENRTEESIANIIASAVKMQLKNVIFARFDGRVIKIYGRFSNADCRREITLVNTWVPEKGFNETESVLVRNKIHDARGCPIVVSTFEIKPTMELREDENKSFHITGGLEGHLVLSIAKYLNRIPVVKVPSVKEKLLVTSDGTISGIVGDVARGVATLGIGQIRPTLDRKNLVDLTTFYKHECIVWTVPLVTKYKYSVVISEFSSTTWIMVILSVSLCCGLVYTIPKLNLGYKSSLNVIDVIAMTLNFAIPRPPSGMLYKLFFLLYLNYSRIISTAYSTSLSSILTTTTLEPAIVDEEGILAAGLRTAGTEVSRQLLVDLVHPNSTRSELINRYEVIMSAEAAVARIIDRHDLAYLRHRSTIIQAAEDLAIAGKSVDFHPLHDCVISYNSVMVTPKGSQLTGVLDKIILSLGEAGIYNHWLSLERTVKLHVKRFESNRQTLYRLEPIFTLYLSCLIPAILTFGAELIAFKLKLNWFTRQSKDQNA